MEENAASGLREQQLRRKRIKKMKSTIVAGIVIWILTTSILTVTLFVKLLHMENRLDELAKSVISVEQVVENQQEKSAASPKETAETLDTVKNGTEEDNLLKEGQTQKVYLTFDDGPSESTS